MGDSGEAHVSEVDAFTMQLERDPLLRSTIVAVALYDRAPDWQILNDRIDRATRLSPTFREKLVASPWRLAPPRWVVDPDFDLSWHLRRVRVRESGGMAAVLTFARNAGMAAFDHDRPLWEFTLLEGLPEGRSALVMKVHHSLTDGIGGIQIATHVVDLERTPAHLGPLPDEPTAQHHGPLDALVDAASYSLRRAAGTARDVAGALPGAVVALRHPFAAAGSAASTAQSIARFVRPVLTTDSPLMTQRRLQWSYQTLDVPLDPLRQAARTIDGSINDGFLGGITGGLRRYHEHHGSPVERLRVAMPISVRTEHDPEGGNKVTLVRFEIPVGISDPVERMSIIDELCSRVRTERAIAYSNAIAGALNLLPISVTGGMLKHIDFLASNVRGFAADVYVGGARLEAFHAFGPTLGSAANITLMSYRATCHIGINTDAGAIPDPEVFVRCMREGFDEVLALAG
ncbi:MAG: wax ester/triacylglycerol synthase domain-containing protein [Acidimicrobiia bacterium]